MARPLAGLGLVCGNLRAVGNEATRSDSILGCVQVCPQRAPQPYDRVHSRNFQQEEEGVKKSSFARHFRKFTKANKSLRMGPT